MKRCSLCNYRAHSMDKFRHYPVSDTIISPFYNCRDTAKCKTRQDRRKKN